MRSNFPTQATPPGCTAPLSSAPGRRSLAGIRHDTRTAARNLMQIHSANHGKPWDGKARGLRYLRQFCVDAMSARLLD